MVTRYQKRISGPLLDQFDTRSAAHIREYCEVNEAGKGLLRAAMRSEQLGMSARNVQYPDAEVEADVERAIREVREKDAE